MVRYPIARLRRLGAGTPAATAGRVTYAEAGEGDARVLIADLTGAVEARVDLCPIVGAWVRVEGHWGGERLEGARLEVLSEPTREFPPAGGEWLRIHGDGAKRLAALRTRAAASRAVRAWFDDREFLEVQTPIAVPSPGLDLHLSAFEVPGMGAPRWLATSPEYQMKRLLAGGLTRIYQLGPVFRRGEVGAHHHPQFSMLEWYRAFSGSAEIMRDTEELVAAVAKAVHGSTRIPARGRVVDVAPPWKRVTVRDAFERIAQVPLEAVLMDEERFFRVLVERIEPGLGYPTPVFLTEWPASMASLARLLPDDPRWADRVEGYIDGLEISNGFGELIDPIEQRARLERDRDARRAQGLEAYPIDERFLAALEEGLPPSGGNALGFDRLVMLLAGASTIDDVVALAPAEL